jgi:GntR family transcriptional repressor for pyruvate dehydrogenase complex
VTQGLSVQPLQRQSVVYLAIEQIRRMVTSGALADGQRLPPERELAELFGVSRPTIREAIRVLGYSGILETKQGSGTYVARRTGAVADLELSLDVSSDGYDDLMEVRLWLEVGACERAATQITEKQVAKLRRLLEVFEAGPREPEPFVEQEVAFHGVIHDASENAVLLSQMRVMGKLIEERLLIAARAFGVREASLTEHWAILAAMEAHDPDQARQAMWFHLTVARDELRRHLGQLADESA